jgi:hypothetical protein
MSPTQKEMTIQIGSAPEDMFKIARRLPAAQSAALMRYEKVRGVDVDAITGEAPCCMSMPRRLADGKWVLCVEVTLDQFMCRIATIWLRV